MWAAAAVLGALLVACGGGADGTPGDGSSPTTPGEGSPSPKPVGSVAAPLGELFGLLGLSAEEARPYLFEDDSGDTKLPSSDFQAVASIPVALSQEWVDSINRRACGQTIDSLTVACSYQGEKPNFTGDLQPGNYYLTVGFSPEPYPADSVICLFRVFITVDDGRAVFPATDPMAGGASITLDNLWTTGWNMFGLSADDLSAALPSNSLLFDLSTEGGAARALLWSPEVVLAGRTEAARSFRLGSSCTTASRIDQGPDIDEAAGGPLETKGWLPADAAAVSTLADG